MQVVLHDMEDDPAAAEGGDLAVPLILDGRLQIGERIASQHLLYDLPGVFQSAHQFIRGTWRTLRLTPRCKRTQLLTSLFQLIVKPPGPHRNDMMRQLFDGTQMRRGTQRQLLRCESSEGSAQVLLVVVPALGKESQRFACF